MTKLFSLQNCSLFILMLILITVIFASTHPIILMIILISWNITLILNMSLYKSMFIYPIMFFIIMISGLLISLLYFASMISNEKSSLSFYTPPFIPTTFSILLILMTLTFTLNTTKLKPPFHNMLSQFMPPLNNNDHYSTLKGLYPSLMNFNFMYSPPLNNLTTISILYLLISLMTIIKICSPKNMSMRKLM